MGDGLAAANGAPGTVVWKIATPYALVGGQAVALWVATKDPAAVRTTKDVDILLRRQEMDDRAPHRTLLQTVQRHVAEIHS